MKDKSRTCSLLSSFGSQFLFLIHIKSGIAYVQFKHEYCLL